ncbi:hypothetical protein [Gracilinema caldarium]|uniref:hypothetical protein n=1 Tax=Gracilinema caldarium TaxID=215591 RepID=UPI0026E99043|nr:hypothetical protein [Gracilinema caldarium]
MKRGCLFHFFWIVLLFGVLSIEAFIILELSKIFPNYIIEIGLVTGIFSIVLVIISYKLFYGNYIDVYLLSGIEEYDNARANGLIRDLRKAQLVYGKNYLTIYSYLVTKPLKFIIENENIVSIKEELVAGVSSGKAELEAVKGAVIGSVLGGAYGAFVGAGMGLGEKNPRIVISISYKTKEGKEKTIRFLYPLLEQFKSKFFKKCYKDKYIPANYI